MYQFAQKPNKVHLISQWILPKSQISSVQILGSQNHIKEPNDKMKCHFTVTSFIDDVRRGIPFSGHFCEIMLDHKKKEVSRTPIWTLT